MNIIIGSDHGGYELKKKVILYLEEKKYNIVDIGCFSEESCDYPNIADTLCNKLHLFQYGILICGTGIGMSIKANRNPKVRCALCHNVETAVLAREHNNSNVLSLGARIVNHDEALKIVDTFLNTEFSDEERHIRRVNILSNISA